MSTQNETSQIPQNPVGLERCDYSLMSTDELFDEFLNCTKVYRRVQKIVGRIYWHLKQKIGTHMGAGGNNNKYDGPTIAGELRKKGCSKHLISRASTMAKVYDRVKGGIMTEEEFEAISWEKAIELNAVTNPNPRTIPRKSGLELRVYTEPLDDVPKSIQSMEESLRSAQDWLIETRSRFPKGSPKEWEEMLAKALGAIGRIRYEAKEKSDTKKHRKQLHEFVA